jgi:hypothetical protein
VCGTGSRSQIVSPYSVGLHLLLLTVENPGIHRFHGEDVDARDGDSEFRVRFRV